MSKMPETPGRHPRRWSGLPGVVPGRRKGPQLARFLGRLGPLDVRGQSALNGSGVMSATPCTGQFHASARESPERRSGTRGTPHVGQSRPAVEAVIHRLRRLKRSVDNTRVLCGLCSMTWGWFGSSARTIRTTPLDLRVVPSPSLISMCQL